MASWYLSQSRWNSVSDDVRFGSLAAIHGNNSSTSAFGGKPDTRQLDFERPRLNVRSHQKRSFNQTRIGNFGGPLSARSEQCSVLLCDEPTICFPQRFSAFVLRGNGHFRRSGVSFRARAACRTRCP